jgi:hypothetical protein
MIVKVIGKPVDRLPCERRIGNEPPQGRDKPGAKIVRRSADTSVVLLAPETGSFLSRADRAGRHPRVCARFKRNPILHAVNGAQHDFVE